MTARRLSLIALVGLSATLAGCGHSAGVGGANVSVPPLVGGVTVIAQARVCDAGANSFCALELVVADRDHRYQSSTDLLSSERRRLRGLGWAATNADTGEQRAAESPGHKLRVTYATAQGDLLGIDRDWIKRTPAIWLALSQTLYHRTSALSMMVETGVS
ncbi:MAG: hypothetical protein ACR2OB_15000 [Solirubrobacteraceae bacterium]